MYIYYLQQRAILELCSEWTKVFTANMCYVDNKDMYSLAGHCTYTARGLSGTKSSNIITPGNVWGVREAQNVGFLVSFQYTSFPYFSLLPELEDFQTKIQIPEFWNPGI